MESLMRDYVFSVWLIIFVPPFWMTTFTPIPSAVHDHLSTDGFGASVLCWQRRAGIN
jgi:hypothetical protein